MDYDWSGDDFLASFDKSGNVKWSNPGYYAQIATSDGGVIAQSYSGQSYTFDANGNSTGQLASLPTQSWTGRAYALGSVEQVAAPLIDTDGSTFWAQAGGNPSANGTSIVQCPWLIQGQAEPHISVQTAIHYLQQLRMKTNNNTFKKSADESIATLRKLQ